MLLNGKTKDVVYKGKTFRFHGANGRTVLLWSDGWELVDEAAQALGWNRRNLGPATYGHVEYTIPRKYNRGVDLQNRQNWE